MTEDPAFLALLEEQAHHAAEDAIEAAGIKLDEAQRQSLHAALVTHGIAIVELHFDAAALLARADRACREFAPRLIARVIPTEA